MAADEMMMFLVLANFVLFRMGLCHFQKMYLLTLPHPALNTIREGKTVVGLNTLQNKEG